MAKVARRLLDGYRAGMHRYSSPLGHPMRASRLFEMGLISVLYKLIEVLQLSRHVTRRCYISLLLRLITEPCAP